MGFIPKQHTKIGINQFTLITFFIKFMIVKSIFLPKFFENGAYSKVFPTSN
jgi:hypothetical protein